MERNYWQEYLENYYKFVAPELGELQNTYPNEYYFNKDDYCKNRNEKRIETF